MILDKFFLRDRWTIGFIEEEIHTVIGEKNSSPKIHWLNHHYTDRFWADPFILDVEENGDIRILAEEMIWTKAKGTIVELLISPDYHLLNRWVLLERDTHLSYPFIERVEQEIYIYPENARSGNLVKYQLCNHKLVEIGVEMNIPICDATKIVLGEYEFWFGTLYGEAQDKDLLAFYRPAKTNMPFQPHPGNPIISSLRHGRPGGAFIQSNGKWYRVAQDCSETYGGALSISEIKSCDKDRYQEHLVFQILPDKDGKCPNGIHTINNYKGLTVVDGIQSKKFAPITKSIFILKNLIERYGRKKLEKDNA